ncbi:unnamed protein product [Leuciscus chuanchicus]
MEELPVGKMGGFQASLPHKVSKDQQQRQGATGKQQQHFSLFLCPSVFSHPSDFAVHESPVTASIKGVITENRAQLETLAVKGVTSPSSFLGNHALPIELNLQEREKER